MRVYALCFPTCSTAAIFVPLQQRRPGLSANIEIVGANMDDVPSGRNLRAVWRQPSVLGSVSTFRVETVPRKMIAGQAVITRIAPVVFRNIQKRNAYCRRVTIISAPARNKVSALVGTPPCRGCSLCVKLLRTLWSRKAAWLVMRVVSFQFQWFILGLQKCIKKGAKMWKPMP